MDACGNLDPTSVWSGGRSFLTQGLEGPHRHWAESSKLQVVKTGLWTKKAEIRRSFRNEGHGEVAVVV